MPNRIGLLTTYYSKNYGAALQAYATLEVLISMGYDCKMVGYKKDIHSHYQPQAIVDEKARMSVAARIQRKIKNAFIKMKRPDQRLAAGEIIRSKAFDSFVKKYLGVSETAYRSPEAFLEAVPAMPYDVFLCGSDQIWNPVTHDFDDVYYLNFPTKAKKVAYASSVAYNRFTPEEQARICDAVRSIDHISVREKSTAAWMQQYLTKKVHHVIDPTFLLDQSGWKKLTTEKQFEGKFILLYVLNYNEQGENVVPLVSDLAKRNGWRVVCLPYTTLKFSKDVQVDYRYDIAPNDFIWLIRNAQCVVTNSFHATALSINLNVPFYVISSRQRDKDLQTRLSDLLEEVGLEDRRIYPDTTSICADNTIDFAPVNAIIEKRRREGFAYLRQALETGDME